MDEKVRYFVAPPIEDIQSTPVRGNSPVRSPTAHTSTQLRAYVSTEVKLSTKEKRSIYGKLPRGGLNGETFLSIATRQSAPADA